MSVLRMARSPLMPRISISTVCSARAEKLIHPSKSAVIFNEIFFILLQAKL